MIELNIRTFKEKVMDKLFLLYLLSHHKISGRTKLQKTVFFAEDSMISQKIKGFNYKFIRYHYGEFSRELESDLDELEKDGLILEKPFFEITEEANEILKKFKNILEKNSEILKRIDMIADFTKRKSLDEVKTVAYTKVIRRGIPVKDIPEETVLLEKISDSESKLNFEIDTGWLETLELLFDKKAKESLDIAIKEKEFLPFQI